MTSDCFVRHLLHDVRDRLLVILRTLVNVVRILPRSLLLVKAKIQKKTNENLALSPEKWKTVIYSREEVVDVVDRYAHLRDGLQKHRNIRTRRLGEAKVRIRLADPLLIAEVVRPSLSALLRRHAPVLRARLQEADVDVVKRGEQDEARNDGVVVLLRLVQSCGEQRQEGVLLRQVREEALVELFHVFPHRVGLVVDDGGEGRVNGGVHLDGHGVVRVHFLVKGAKTSRLSSESNKLVCVGTHVSHGDTDLNACPVEAAVLKLDSIRSKSCFHSIRHLMAWKFGVQLVIERSLQTPKQRRQKRRLLGQDDGGNDDWLGGGHSLSKEEGTRMGRWVLSCEGVYGVEAVTSWVMRVGK